MGFFKGLWSLWQAFAWLRRQKKELECNADAYLSEERAAQWRLRCEVVFKALEDGQANPNFASIPKWVRWVCGTTTIDNRIGLFGQRFLKSTKLAESNPVLRERQYPRH